MATEAVLEISAGFQQVKLGERGGRRHDFHDSGINTRQAMEHVKESKTGSSGSAIQLSSNFFRILSRPRWVLYQYHVDFNPPMESRRLRSALLFQHEETLGSSRTFDGAILFLPRRLPNKETVLHSDTRNGEHVKITVTLTNELPPTSPVCLQFYNIIFRRILRMLDMQQIGRNYYNAKDSLNILTIWPGYTTTILQYESSIMLCTDVSHKVLRSETVLDFMYNLRQRCGEQHFLEACTKELVGLIVLTKYNNKTYKIDDIAWDYTPKNTFKRGDADVTFMSYYKSVGVLLTNVENSEGGLNALIARVCMRTDFNMMKELAHHTRLAPQERERRLTGFVNNIQRNTAAQAELNTWGLNIDKQLLKLNGRVLQGEVIYEYDPSKAEWSREMRGIPVISSPPLDNWVMFYPRRNANEAQNLLGLAGSWVVRPFSCLLAHLQGVVILPTNRKDKYDNIKKYLCVDCPTPSQCVVSRTISKPQTLMTVATKIALQMSCKMGGELWSVEIPLKQLMIVGIDCYHDTAAGKRSIGALVASLNQGMTRWFSKCVLQNRGQEIMDGLKMGLTGALKDYLKFNNCLPSRIIVYRDGVGDGMLQSVVSYEVPQIMDSIKSMGHDYMPKLSVVVVKKRISTRFFAHMNGRLSNPPPGTVIDTEVTRPEWYDFFIVSQTVRQGSVSPTHYNVVYDTSGLKPDHMQRLTYKLCHMYYNWQGIIRVPAPCQYAHKLAFLVGQSIHREPSMHLDDYLFYL
uniref:Piwi-like RNA-mediated gene silencing 1 n=1 Tax=Myripristis murdjan TaxID=586833 RepID=A0A668A751_9TELE